MIEFHLIGSWNDSKGRYEGVGEVCLMRLSAIMCLFPEQRQIRTENGWTVTVCEEDWPKVEAAFRAFTPQFKQQEP
jgi:hypothetical protein